MVVYADVIFFINAVSSYIMLYIIGRAINKTKIRKKRAALSSILGGIAATVVFCLDMPIYAAYIVRIAAALAMLLITFYEQKKKLFHQFIWYVLINGIMAFSMLIMMSILNRSTGIIEKAGVLYFDVPENIFILSFIAAYLIMTLFLKLLNNRRAKKYYIMSVTHNDKTITVSALFDSGNLLKEPITGKCVSIIEWEEAKKLFNAEYEFSELENHVEEMKLWVIPFNSLGNSAGILFAFLADCVTIPEENKCIDKTFIGIYGSRLSQKENYHALINAGLL